MRIISWLPLAAMLVTNTLSGATLRYLLSDVGASAAGDRLHRYTYTVSDLSLAPSQEIDIRFDPAVFQLLLNPLAPTGFSTLVLQPNNPPGAFGDFSALAVISNPAILGAFSVDFILAQNGTPGPQSFSINEFDPVTGNFVRTIESGTTALAGPNAVPEPRTLWPAALVLLLCFSWKARPRF